MNHLITMIRIEVIAPADVDPAVHELISSAGATGYTSVAGVSGVGHSGPHNGPHRFNDQDALGMTITVLPAARAEPLIEALRELLEGGSGVMFITDTWVSRSQYFQ
ncbi:transcriptional regulator [Curtobacterium flaccumfaciens pv. beticola]|uniref:P-II family nitrogen regulator n=1 Tax=Curtobacterium flaccumfaciens TaxID=2035 RepID=UPI00349F4843|nr:transcriptional regulator [Curtobacterium flaccumfaciens pv. basellae]